MLSRTHKLILGIAILLLVDLIWVSSSELTKVNFILRFAISHILQVFLASLQFLYQNENFDKPFFCTYFKTSMFTFYLLIMGLIAPWKDACEKNGNNYTVSESRLKSFESRSTKSPKWLLNWYIFLPSKKLARRPKCRRRKFLLERPFIGKCALYLQAANGIWKCVLKICIEIFSEWLHVCAHQNWTVVGNGKWWL